MVNLHLYRDDRGEEQTAVRFSIGADGRVLDVNRLAKKLVPHRRRASGPRGREARSLSGAGLTGGLTGLYAALALLLISLQLRTAWPWPVKASTIAIALPASIGTFLAVEAEIGWPSGATLPDTFQLHAALIEEPMASTAEDGAIFLWLTPWAEAEPMMDEFEDEDTEPLTSSLRPRAFTLPYSRELHQQIEAMREHLAKGEMVTGNHQAKAGWQRRFARQDGAIELDAPPPPPPPKKDG